MMYYPIFLRVAGRACLVIGGGQVAEHKTHSLLAAAAHVTVISPEVTPALHQLAGGERIALRQRPYASGDLTGFFLAYAATDDEDLHAQIAAEAHEAGVLLNVVDRPQQCDFIVPSIMQRGDLVIAVSTGGASPALAARIRRDLEAVFGPEYALALQLLRRLRERLAAEPGSGTDRRRILSALTESPLLEYLRNGQRSDLDALLASTVGSDVSLASLGIDLPLDQ